MGRLQVTFRQGCGKYTGSSIREGYGEATRIGGEEQKGKRRRTKRTGTKRKKERNKKDRNKKEKGEEQKGQEQKGKATGNIRESYTGGIRGGYGK